MTTLDDWMTRLDADESIGVVQVVGKYNTRKVLSKRHLDNEEHNYSDPLGKMKQFIHYKLHNPKL